MREDAFFGAGRDATTEGRSAAEGMISRQRKLCGGYRFSRFEGQPAASLLALDVPERVIVLLQQGFRDPVNPVVGTGDSVLAGQLVGRDDDSVSSPVHSSVNGTVEEIKPPDAEQGSAGCVIIRTDGPGPFQKLPGHTAQWQDVSAEVIEELLYTSGVTALGGGIPTRYRSAAIAPDEVDDIIVHDAGSEMYNPSLALLLGGERLQHFVQGLQILKKVMPAARVHVALDDREKSLIEDLSNALSVSGCADIRPLAPRYPQDYDEVLVPTLLGRDFPHGYAAANIGVVTLDCQAVLHVYDAVTQGKPLIERTIALCGPGFDRPAHANVLLGTPLGDLTRQAALNPGGLKLVRNSTLTGQVLADSACPIDRTFTALVALPRVGAQGLMPFARPGLADDAYSRTFLACVLPMTKKVDARLKGEPRPCVSCGYCQNVCPVGIIPHLLYKYVSRGYLEDRLVEELKIFNCIGCNLCSYVCPSKIGVGSYIKSGQAKLLEEGLDNSTNVLPFFDMKGLEPVNEEDGRAE